MEIHRPTPWHGLREFLKEYLIVVVGVLTALGAEQAAEAWRWNERAAEARERLRTEISHQYLVDQEYLAIEPCLDRQLEAIQRRLLASGPTLSPLPTEPGDTDRLVYHAPFRSWTDSAWQDALSEGIVAHLNDDERRLLPIHYSQLGTMRRVSQLQQDTTTALQALGTALPMPPAVKAEYLSMVAQERLRIRGMATLSRQMNRDVDKVGYTPDLHAQQAWIEASQTMTYCRGLKASGHDVAPPR